MTTDSPNPFAPGAAADDAREPGAPQKPARWLALLGTIACSYPLMGVGHFVMGRGRRWAAWVAAGIVAFALMVVAVRIHAAKLFLGVIVGMVLAFLTSLIDVARVEAGPGAPPLRRALIVIALVFVAERVIAMATREWIVEAFSIPSGAMFPGLLVGDHVMVNKGSNADRGALITFKYPQDPSIAYLKRVVGVGGDTVEIKLGALIINGSPLPSTPIPGSVVCTDTGDSCDLAWEENGGHVYQIALAADRPLQSFGPVIVPAGHLFVLGDNRDNSSDSRVWGPLPIANVTGTIAFLYWSRDVHGVRWDRIGTAPP